MTDNLKNIEVELKLFNNISKNNKTTQRSISKELDVALGFANSLIKKFLRKGLLKITEAPMKRYIYYITPKGFVEKSKLVGQFIDSSLAFYKKTKKEYEDKFLKIKEQNFNKVILVGTGELSEIAVLSASITNTKIYCIFDEKLKISSFCGIKVTNKLNFSKLNKKKTIFFLSDSINSQKMLPKLVDEGFDVFKPKFLMLD